MSDRKQDVVMGKIAARECLEQRLEELLELVRAGKVHQCALFYDCGDGISTTTITCTHERHRFELVECAFEALDKLLLEDPDESLAPNLIQH